MKLIHLHNKQRELDSFIYSNNDLTGVDLVECKIQALLVEIAEASNEIRAFKYWSKKGRSLKEVIIEELADCLHFFLSIGNDLRVVLTTEVKEFRENKSLVNRFNVLFNRVSDLSGTLNYMKDIYIKVAFQEYLRIIKDLDYTWEDIEKAYQSKYEENIQRQLSGY